MGHLKVYQQGEHMPDGYDDNGAQQKSNRQEDYEGHLIDLRKEKSEGFKKERTGHYESGDGQSDPPEKAFPEVALE